MKTPEELASYIMESCGYEDGVEGLAVELAARDEDVRRAERGRIAALLDTRSDKHIDEFGNFPDQWHEGAYDALQAAAHEIREGFSRETDK